MRLFFLLAIIIGLSACEKERSEIPEQSCVKDEQITRTDSMIWIYSPGPQEYGNASAIFVNKSWEASAKSFYSNVDSFFTIVLSSYYDDGFIVPRVQRNLWFKIKRPLTGCFKVYKNDSLTMFTAVANHDRRDGDVIIYKYHLDDDADNFLEITEVIPETQTVKGKFMVSFTREDTTAKDPWDLHHVRFFNGEFECRLKE